MTPTKDQKADLITNAAIEAAAQEKLGIVPYFSNELTKYCSKFGEYEQIDAFRKGALWMQAEMEKLIEQRELVAWDAAREPRKWTQVFGPQSHIPEGQRYETFEDWKKAK